VLKADKGDAARFGPHASDAELVARVRSGAVDAFEALYRRHVASAQNVARSLVPADAAEDAVAEAFTRVLRTISAGGGPETAFRAYLLTTVRNLAHDRVRSERRVIVTDDIADDTRRVETAEDADPVALRADAEADARLVAMAFATLPSRWRAVLWELEVEGKTPASLAPQLSMSANSVAALAMRAREGLRQAYLQAHIATGIPPSCEAHAGRLAKHARGRLGRRHGRTVNDHLECCARCRGLYADLRELNEQLGALLPPVAAGAAGALSAAAGHAVPAGHAAAGALHSASAWAKARYLLRLHPVVSAGAGAGVVAAGGMVFAVAVMPVRVPPVPHQHASVFPGMATQATYPRGKPAACSHGVCPSRAHREGTAQNAATKAPAVTPAPTATTTPTATSGGNGQGQNGNSQGQNGNNQGQNGNSQGQNGNNQGQNGQGQNGNGLPARYAATVTGCWDACSGMAGRRGRGGMGVSGDSARRVLAD
jgi:RNA polymerase sigma factor (sigma-70 family)